MPNALVLCSSLLHTADSMNSQWYTVDILMTEQLTDLHADDPWYHFSIEQCLVQNIQHFLDACPILLLPCRACSPNSLPKSGLWLCDNWPIRPHWWTLGTHTCSTAFHRETFKSLPFDTMLCTSCYLHFVVVVPGTDYCVFLIAQVYCWPFTSCIISNLPHKSYHYS